MSLSVLLTAVAVAVVAPEPVAGFSQYGLVHPPIVGQEKDPFMPPQGGYFEGCGYLSDWVDCVSSMADRNGGHRAGCHGIHLRMQRKAAIAVLSAQKAYRRCYNVVNAGI